MVISEMSSVNTVVVCFAVWCRFKWDVKQLGSDFSLSPTEGYISAGVDVPFDVVYHPRDVSNDLRSEVSTVSLKWLELVICNG